MDNIEEIKKRFKKGYVMSIYGTSANLHNQMRSDIETLLKALSIHSVSYPLPKGVKIKSAETAQGFEFDQIDYDNWLESDIDDLDDFLEQEVC